MQYRVKWIRPIQAHTAPGIAIEPVEKPVDITRPQLLPDQRLKNLQHLAELARQVGLARKAVSIDFVDSGVLPAFRFQKQGPTALLERQQLALPRQHYLQGAFHAAKFEAQISQLLSLLPREVVVRLIAADALRAQLLTLGVFLRGMVEQQQLDGVRPLGILACLDGVRFGLLLAGAAGRSGGGRTVGAIGRQQAVVTFL